MSGWERAGADGAGPGQGLCEAGAAAFPPWLLEQVSGGAECVAAVNLTLVTSQPRGDEGGSEEWDFDLRGWDKDS